jgi:hypothetical protein
VLKCNEIIGLFGESASAGEGSAILLAIAALAALVSSVRFSSWKAYLRSPKAPGTYHSLFFFEHVAEHPDGAAYLAALRDADGDTVIADLAAQAHALAQGARTKFRLMNAAVVALMIELGPSASF